MKYTSVFGFGAHYIVELTVIYCEIIGRDFAQVILYIATININASLMAMSFPLWSCLSNKSNTDVYHYHYYESHIKHMRKFAWYIIFTPKYLSREGAFTCDYSIGSVCYFDTLIPHKWIHRQPDTKSHRILSHFFRALKSILFPSV